MRRKSSQNDPVAMRGNTPEMREHLKKLGPSNVASRPKQTRINTVKIKPGVATVPEGAPIPQNDLKRGDVLTPDIRPTSRPPSVHEPASEHQGGVGEGLLNSAGKEASDGVQALQRGYGTMSGSWSQRSWSPEAGRGRSSTANGDADDSKTKDTTNGTNGHDDQSPKSQQNQFPDKIVVDMPHSDGEVSEDDSGSTVGDLEPMDSGKKNFYNKRQAARSGSITENIIDVGGVRKVVLEPGSSSEGDEHDGDEGAKLTKQESQHDREVQHRDEEALAATGARGKGKKKKRAGKGRREREEKKTGGGGEGEPLLGKGGRS